MADKKLNELTTASDGAYVYAEDASGYQIKISKADLASVVAEFIGPGIRYSLLTSGSMDLNTITEQTTYLIYNTCTNTPRGMGSYGWVTTIPSYATAYATQILFSDGVPYFRTKDNGVWSSWRKFSYTSL